LRARGRWWLAANRKSDTFFTGSECALVAGQSVRHPTDVLDHSPFPGGNETHGVVLDLHTVVDRLLQLVDCSCNAQHRALLAAADKAGHAASEMAGMRDGGLNARFQKLADQLASSIKTGSISNVAETMQCCNELERVARDFCETARTYGRVIINEMHLPVEAKTVRPKLGACWAGTSTWCVECCSRFPTAKCSRCIRIRFTLRTRWSGASKNKARAAGSVTQFKLVQVLRRCALCVGVTV
jgi:hypothetical protein